MKLASDLWLETGQEWYPGTWPPSGFNYVANGPDPSSDDPWVEAPFLHPIMVKLKQLLCRIFSYELENFRLKSREISQKAYLINNIKICGLI